MTFNAGHLRAVITISFTFAIIGGFLMGLISPDVFMAVAGSAIGFYFAKHDPIPGADPQPGVVALNVHRDPVLPLRQPIRPPIPFEPTDDTTK